MNLWQKIESLDFSQLKTVSHWIEMQNTEALLKMPSEAQRFLQHEEEYISLPWKFGQMPPDAMDIGFSRRLFYIKLEVAKRYSREGHYSVLLDQLDGLVTRIITSSEVIYQPSNAPGLIISDAHDELKKYFAKHPEKLRELNSRKFEILVADILKDFGFEIELTQQSRDKGRDIYAYMKNQVSSFLMLVECKRYNPPNHVGIDIVQRMVGVCQSPDAHKGMIVTTSFFTRDALMEQQQPHLTHKMDLVDYDRFKGWLQHYKN